MKNSYIFHISAQNIECGYLLEPPRRGGSNEYPQSMFLSRNKKNNVYPCKPQFYYIKVGFKLYRYVFVMIFNGSDPALFVIKYMNFYQQNQVIWLAGIRSERGILIYSARQGLKEIIFSFWAYFLFKEDLFSGVG